MKLIDQIEDDYFRKKLYEIIYGYNSEARLSKLKEYVMKHSYFKKFGYEPTWLAYQIYIESLNGG